MVMRLNNIYSVGDYFFIDFSIENKTNIRFDIDEIRVKLSDKKLSKATNAQTIELTPALVLEHGKTFKHGYRNRDCREKDDLSERQAADYRNDGTTNQRAQYQPEH